MAASDSGDRSHLANQPWRELLRDLNVTPSKALGQNFLHDQKIVRRIVREANVGENDDVLEIGPGLGILTQHLVENAQSVTVIELDSRLAERIRTYFGDQVRVVEGDVLDIDIDAIAPQDEYIVVANLPYSVATAAIQRLCEAKRSPRRMVLMVQREVADRMAARPPNMSILSVAVQFYGRVRTLFRVGSGAFIPRPRVESAVVEIVLHEAAPLPRELHQHFFRLVRAGFAQRRKRISNSIASHLGVDKAILTERLHAAEIDPGRRAETLDINEWVTLFHEFQGVLHD